MEKNRRRSRSGRTFRGSSSSAGPPWHESSIAKNYFEIELDQEELFAIELDMDQRGPLGQRKSPKCQSPQTGLEHVCQSSNATAEFPQILVRGLELKGECEESGSTIIHRKCGQDARFSSGHTSVSCVCRLNVAAWQPIVVNLATQRTSSRCVCRLNAA